MSRHLSGAPLKGAKEKKSKVPHLPPTEQQKRWDKKASSANVSTWNRIYLANTPSQTKSALGRWCLVNKFCMLQPQWLLFCFLFFFADSCVEKSCWLIQMSPITSGVVFGVCLWPLKLNVVQQRLRARRKEKPSHCSQVKGPLYSEERRWQLVGSSHYRR